MISQLKEWVWPTVIGLGAAIVLIIGFEQDEAKIQYNFCPTTEEGVTIIGWEVTDQDGTKRIVPGIPLVIDGERIAMPTQAEMDACQ